MTALSGLTGLISGIARIGRQATDTSKVPNSWKCLANGVAPVVGVSDWTDRGARPLQDCVRQMSGHRSGAFGYVVPTRPRAQHQRKWDSSRSTLAFAICQ